jgi:hypothetical protein
VPVRIAGQTLVVDDGEPPLDLAQGAGLRLEDMDDQHTSTGIAAGRFRAMTGLSEKALRLYAERGLLTPAATDPSTGYRSYDAEQVREGIILDVLRRARVPLGELAATGFAYDDWRGRLALRRSMEDFHLDVAERIEQGDPSAFTIRSVDAPAAHFVATSSDLGAPGDPGEALDLFGAMALDLPATDRALTEVLREHGVILDEESWTAVVGADPAQRMLVAHRTAGILDESERARIAADLTRRLGGTADVVTGTLPARRELSFAAPERSAPDETGVDEIADDYLRLAAFADHVRRHALTPLSSVPRRRVDATSMFDGRAPETVFDVVLENG